MPNSNSVAVIQRFQAWLAANRAGKTWAWISVNDGVAAYESSVDPPVIINDPGLDLPFVNAESTSLVRDGAEVLILDDISSLFLGTNVFNLAIGSVEGCLFDFALSASTSGLTVPVFDRFASYKAILYYNIKSEEADPGSTEAEFDVNLALIEAGGFTGEAEYLGNPALITTDGLLAQLGEFFHFDPLTGVDLPL